jgi:hypothetical protein
MFLTLRPHFWTPTPCTIVQSATTGPMPVPGRWATQSFVIGYRYRLGDRTYTSDQYSAGLQESRDPDTVHRILSTYPVGAESRCYVNPKDPFEAVLIRTGMEPAFSLLIPTLFLVIGFSGIVAIARARPGVPLGVPRSSEAGSSRLGALVWPTLFGLLFDLLAYAFGISPVLTWLSTKSWPATPCEIISSGVGVHYGGRKAINYSADIVYRYRIGGHEYRSSQVSLSKGSWSGRSSKEAITAQYRAGSQAICYVNPQDPFDTLLNRGLPWFVWLALIPAFLFFCCLKGIFNALRKITRESDAFGSDADIAPPTLPENHG